VPFNSETGAAAGRKGTDKNRWKGKDPSTIRSEKILFKATPDEKAMMDDKAATAGVSRGELIIRAVKKYKY
jgi:hypothetical protein